MVTQMNTATCDALVRPKSPAESQSPAVPDELLPLSKRFSAENVRFIACLIRPHYEIRSVLIEKLLDHQFISYSQCEIQEFIECELDGVRIGRLQLFATAVDSDLADAAESLADDAVNLLGEFRSRSHTKRPSLNEIKSAFERFCGDRGFSFPFSQSEGQSDLDALDAAVSRVVDGGYWRRVLRACATQILYDYLRLNNRVGAGISPYIPEAVNRRLRQRQRDSRKFLESRCLVRDDDFEMDLIDAVDASTSNPRNRFSESYTRIQGMETLAFEAGFCCLFFTLTAPSRFHVRNSIAKGRLSAPNKKFSGESARSCQDYLNGVWKRFRARAARQEYTYYGARFVEGHHDGTPHWHILLFCPSGQADPLSSDLQMYACLEDAHELSSLSAREARFNVKRFDLHDLQAGLALPSTYLFKYMSKNMTGGSDLDNESGMSFSETVERVTNFCRANRIRQFQFFGNPSVTVWRELRRLRAEDLSSLDAEELTAIRDACVSGDWAEFVRLMGGPCSPRTQQPVTALQVLRCARAEKNRYGEVVLQLRGLVMELALGDIRQIITRPHDWVITRKKSAQANFVDRQGGAPPALSAGLG